MKFIDGSGLGSTADLSENKHVKLALGRVWDLQIS